MSNKGKNEPDKGDSMKRFAAGLNEAIEKAAAEALKRDQIAKRKRITAKRKQKKLNETQAKKSEKKPPEDVFNKLIKDVASKLSNPDAINVENIGKKRVRKVLRKKKKPETTGETSQYIDHLPKTDPNKVTYEGLEKKSPDDIMSYEDLENPELREEWMHRQLSRTSIRGGKQ